MSEICFVLFSVCKNEKRKTFDPSLCGIFLNKEEAKKSEKILYETGNYFPFILEFPICSTSENWIEYSKSYIKEKIIKEITKSSLTPNIILKQNEPLIEYKINRKKIEK